MKWPDKYTTSYDMLDSRGFLSLYRVKTCYLEVCSKKQPINMLLRSSWGFLIFASPSSRTSSRTIRVFAHIRAYVRQL